MKSKLFIIFAISLVFTLTSCLSTDTRNHPNENIEDSIIYSESKSDDIIVASVLDEEELFDINTIIDDIPYYPPTWELVDKLYSPVLTDDMALDLTGFLMMVHTMVPDSNEYIFESSETIDNTFMEWASVINTNSISWNPQRPKSEINFPELSSLGKNNSELGGVLEEHAQKTAKYLFGDNAYISPEGIGDVIYYREKGYYIVEGYGIISRFQPIITSYTQEDNIFTLKVAFVNFGPVGEIEDNFDGIEMGYTDEDGKYIPLSELKEYALNSPQHKIVLEQREDGSYIYRSHVLEFN